jgi:hypothetical protein
MTGHIFRRVDRHKCKKFSAEFLKPQLMARQLNERLRKVMQYQTPEEKFAECVAAIGWRRSKQPSKLETGCTGWLLTLHSFFLAPQLTFVGGILHAGDGW